MKLYCRSSIIKKIKGQRARWLEHVYQMNTHRHAKKVLMGANGGRRRRGRPKKKWIKDVKGDIREIVKKIEAMGIQSRAPGE
ncbi:hypothetical protein ILUMI_14401 [Ignelater luminosus]|uniref:Uncharacterized protein n=1 Tax=Ignelater luminosus TaxID=2038154 RepID=A0A8K0CWM6_IGNLU|nr:hypothetical protein ILUMI_14401 [Ignelater luminosus]